MTGIVIMAVHFILIAVLYMLRRRHVLSVSPALLFAGAFLPVFGELAVLAVCIQKASGRMGAREDELEMMDKKTRRTSIYFQKQEDYDRTVVPLEDALIINDSVTRRSVMLDILMDNSTTYLGAMRQAIHNDDTEVVHYATTALTGMSEKADARLQKAEKDFNESGGSDETLNEYILVLRQYLKDGMAEGALLQLSRARYQKLLQIRIDRYHDRDDYAAISESYLDSGDYEAADRNISVLEEHWKKSTDTLQLRLRYDFQLGRGVEMHELLEKVSEDGMYPSRIQDVIDFWEEDRADAQA